MSVKLELYRVFKEVAEAGNITAAAQNLFISQSAVSQSVKQLESDLQTRLFARNSRGVSLTPDGKMLYEYVRSAMGLLETGEEKLSQSVPAALSGSFPPAVSRRAYPDHLRPQPQGAGPAAIGQGGHRLCQHATGCIFPEYLPLL